jgi:predicted phosphodiesterase
MKEIKSEITRLTRSEKEIVEHLRAFTTSNTSPEKEIIYETVREPIMYEEGKSRVLVIGDIHAPFDLPDYLDHCKQMYEYFNCDTVVFIGDLIDNHYSSYHCSDPDGMGAKDELDLAIEHIQLYYEAFPEATVTIGNHDKMAFRKQVTGGLPKAWIRDYKEVLNTPNWDFVVDVEIDNVIYIHGEGGTARTKYKSEEQSVVQGHLHTQAYIEWLFAKNTRKFAMQVGTGIDFSSYAFAYAKAGKKPAISCGVVLNGTQPFLLPMIL